MTRDPLFWAGIVLGTVLGIIGVITRDLSGGSAVWAVLCGVFGFTWLVAGGLGVVIRGYFRRRRDRKADIGLLLKDGVQLKEVE
ncbi:hypothetical protein [Streptomyces sp. SID13031]|uniref:hypothetical protein n=1 Tax=Streptomyces sp. SID13031 TaxID=2706046 RepID=UPI0013CA61BE|nr:hypothetical protein [Streptomyces sp. SID13031]NEA34345.1 hypothetical protein [Streptomyces sp. SID13031]